MARIGHARLVDPHDQRGGFTPEGSGETSAEQRVDHETRPGDLGPRGILDRARPARHRGGRGSLQGLAWPEQGEPDRDAARPQAARGHNTVAPVVARSAHHEHRAACPRTPQALGAHRDRGAGAIHQDRLGRPGGDRQAIGFAHLARGEQFSALVIRHADLPVCLSREQHASTAADTACGVPRRKGF